MIHYIVTKPDGSLVRDDNGKIMTWRTRDSVRYQAKHRTFNTKTKHHSWALTEDEYHSLLKSGIDEYNG